MTTTMKVRGVVGILAAAAMILVAWLFVGGTSSASSKCFGSTPTIRAIPGQVTIGTSGADVIVGTSGPDVIRSRGGADKICARGGNDRVLGGVGNDRINLGSGNDFAKGGPGNDLISGKGGRDKMEGNGGQDTLVGGRGADQAWGGDKSDRIKGGPGPDRLWGNRGDDALDGGPGNDECHGGKGTDTGNNCEKSSGLEPPPTPTPEPIPSDDDGTARLTPSAMFGEGFGHTVSLDADTAVVGAPEAWEIDLRSGAAFVFTRTGSAWAEQAKIVPDDGALEDWFGWSLSVDGDTVLVGAHKDDDNGADSGSAYVFTRSGNTWTQEAKLLPSDGAAGHQFGWAAAVDGDTALISTNLDDDTGESPRTGAVYVFTRTGTTWSQQAKLLPSDGHGSDRFGWAVAVDGDTALVGAWGDDDNGFVSGSAYVFTRTGTTWSQQAKLLPSDGAEGDRFAWSLSLDLDTALVGARLDDDNGSESGSAYVFTRTGTTWSQQAKLLPSDGAEEDYFGEAVSVDRDTALVGAYGDDNGRGGAAYVFKRSGVAWTQVDKLLPSDGARNDDFAKDLAVDDDTALVGASRSTNEPSSSFGGAAYAFSPIEGPSAARQQ